jgi:hypothetical protein
MAKNVLLLSVEILKDRTGIHDNIDPKLLYPEIKTAQDMYIEPILGTSLFNKIITEVEAGSITGDYKTLLDDYIIDTLLNYTMAGLPDAISFQFWNKGVVRKQGDNTELPDMSDLVDIMNKYRVRAEWYAERLNRRLKTIATSEVLPEYLSGNNTLSDIQPENTSYTMPIYLGKSRYRSFDSDNCHDNQIDL